jgi:hypothetical protein
VRKALAAGRITPSADGTLDPETVDQQWTTSTDLSKPRNSVIGAPMTRKRHATAGPLRAPAHEDELVDLPGDGGAPRLASSYAASRAAREGYLARLAKLEFEQRSGKLVDADEVRAQVFALGRRLRDSLMGLPDRLTPLLAGQTEQTVIHRLLTQELMTSLAELSAAPAAGVRAGVETTQ